MRACTSDTIEIMVLSIFLVLTLMSMAVFYRLWLPLGGWLTGERLRRISRSPHHLGKQFVNLTETAMHMDIRETVSMVVEHFTRAKDIRPPRALRAVRPDIAAF